MTPLHGYTAPEMVPSNPINPLSVSVVDIPATLRIKRSQSHNHLVDTLSLSVKGIAPVDASLDTIHQVSPTKRKVPTPLGTSQTRRRSSLVDTTAASRRYAPLEPPSQKQRFRINHIVPPIILPQSHAYVSSNQEQCLEPQDNEEEGNKPSPPKRKRASFSNQNQDAREITATAAAIRTREALNAVPRRPGACFRFASLLLNQHPGTAQLFGAASDSMMSSTAMSPPSPLRQRQKQVECICHEIIRTEESYVASVRALLTHFFEPLASFAAAHALPLNAMNGLHTSTITILSIHEELLRQLQPIKALNEPQPSPQCDVLPHDPFGLTVTHGSLWWIHQLTQAFCATIEYMKVEAFYCASYRCAKMELEQLQHKHPCLHAFTLELYDRARAPPRNVDIISNLIKPVQRICAYPLLFRELLKQSPGPEETLMIQQSLAKIEAVVNHVNEKVRQVENNARLYELHASLNSSSAAKIELLQPSRVLLYETTATMINLDAPRWPAKILRVLRRRLRRSSSDEINRLGSINETIDGNDRRLSYCCTEADSPHRGSSTISARFGSVDFVRSSFSTVLSPINSRSGQTGSFRRSNGGERVRLILLSDMLLMAKRKEQHLKIRRQICLSCAIVHDMEAALSLRDEGANVEVSSPLSVCSDCRPTTTPYSTTLVLEVSKIGRCHCHHLSPATLRRPPWVNPLSSLLRSASTSIIRRTSSMSLDTNASQLYTNVQRDSAPAHITSAHCDEKAIDSAEDEGEDESEVDEGDQFCASRSRPSASCSQSQSRVSRGPEKAGSSSPFSPFRSVKRYIITCETPKEKTEFVHALQQAISRAARGSPTTFRADKDTQDSNALWSHPSTSLHHLGDRAKAVAKVAVQFPTKLWHSFHRTTPPSHRASSSRNRMLTPTHRHGRRRRSFAHSTSADYRNSFPSEADLLELDLHAPTYNRSKNIDCTTA